MIKNYSKRLQDYGSLVMFSHSVFSLPFGLMAMCFAAGGVPDWRVFIWVLLALLGARNGANALNRIIDRKIDAKNPRTAGRHLPRGAVSEGEAWGIVLLCFAVLVLAAGMLNTVCLVLSPLAIALFIFYSYSKRLTWLCHYVLGVACGGAPVGAWLAITGKPSLIPFVMAAAVCFWVAGFDILYATQDIDFDRREELLAIPARFGLLTALRIAAVSHVLAVVFLAVLPFFVPELRWVYGGGVLLIGVLLVVEHGNVQPGHRRKMRFVAYHINQMVSVVFLLAAAVDFFF